MAPQRQVTVRSLAALVAALVLTVSALSPAAGAQDRADMRLCAPCPPEALCQLPACPDGRCAIEDCRRMVPAFAQRTATRVRATLDGRIVRYEIEDRYVNRGSRPAEVDYVLPLPRGAAFENLDLSINGEMVSGETMRAERARAVYEEIVRKLRDPALVEWMGHDLLRTRIFPIQPGEEKIVVVRFSAVAVREGDALRLDWPARPLAGARTDDDSFELRYPHAGAGETFGRAYSPTHSLSVNDRERGLRVARTTGSARTMTVLVPVTRDSEVSLTLLAHRPAGEDGYALVTLSPPTRDAKNAPRDLTFVVDVSGSMSGEKIVQARAAGRQFLGSLAPQDRFRIIAFSGDVRTFRDGWTTATGPALRQAEAFIDGLRASGGTNIAGALEEALGSRSSSGRLPLVLFITDGAPTVGETRPEAIATRAADLRGRARVFTFGLGADVNAALLEQLALQGRGTASFLRPGESVERAVGVVAERLTSPVATDVTVRLDGVRLYAVQPQWPIDLFAGQDLVVLARYSGRASSGTLVVSGRGPNGPVRWTQEVRLDEGKGRNSFVARLWAVQRVGWLSAERRRTGGNRELDAELRELGERHGIPTELTSYLVVEPGMPTTLASSNDPAAPRDRVRRDAATTLPMSAPTSALGQAAAGAGNAVREAERFEAAKVSAEQRAVTSLADERMNATDALGRELKVVGARSFKQDSAGVWTDTRARTSARIARIRAYSPAYFALLRELPELAPMFAVGERVRVEGRAVTIELAPDAPAELDDSALRAIVRDWR